LAYTEEFKESFIKEFLVRYQKDSTLSLRQFGIEKFGKFTSFIYQWLTKYDSNKIYNAKRTKGQRKRISPIITSPVVKITNNNNQDCFRAKANISIKAGNALIEMGNNYCKDDLVLVLSALKEASNAN